MFGAMKSLPSYRLSGSGEAQGKATGIVMQWWQKFAVSFEDSLQDT